MFTKQSPVEIQMFPCQEVDRTQTSLPAVGCEGQCILFCFRSSDDSILKPRILGPGLVFWSFGYLGEASDGGTQSSCEHRESTEQRDLHLVNHGPPESGVLRGPIPGLAWDEAKAKPRKKVVKGVRSRKSLLSIEGLRQDFVTGSFA